MADLTKAIKKVARFAKSGFLGHDGRVAYISEEVLSESIDKAIGLPVLLEHNDDGRVYGYVSNIFRDGDWYLAEMMIHDENMAKVLDQADKGGFKTSTGFFIESFKEGNFLRNDVPYQVEIDGIRWKEWTLTRNPKYQDAIILNSSDHKKDDQAKFDGDFISEKEENSDQAVQNEIKEVTNSKEKELTMSKTIIEGKEYDTTFVKNAIENFEQGSTSFISKLMNSFKSNEVKNSSEVEEEEIKSDEPKQDEVKEEVQNEKEVSAEESKDEEKGEEVQNSSDEEDAKEDSATEEEKKDDKEVQNSSKVEDKKVETKTATEVKNSMSAPVSTVNITGFAFAEKKY